MSDRIESKRVALEPLRVDHANEMVGVLADPHLYTFDGGQVPDLASLTRRYTTLVAGSGDDGEQWLNWVIRDTTSGNALGYVQATIEPTETEVAWVVGTPWQGKGYASESARAMSGWLASNGGTPLVAWIPADHVGSHNVAKAIGLTLTDELDEDGEQAWR